MRHSLTQHHAGDVERLQEMAQERPLDPSDRPAAELVTVRHAADPGPPHAGVEDGRGDQGALGMALQLQGGVAAV